MENNGECNGSYTILKLMCYSVEDSSDRLQSKLLTFQADWNLTKTSKILNFTMPSSGLEGKPRKLRLPAFIWFSNLAATYL
ncbi:unnamed protein product [Brassica oleracea]